MLRHIVKRWVLTGLMGLVSLWCLVGCSDDQEQRGRQVTLEAQPLIQPYHEDWPSSAARAMGQRAWSPPSGYTTYESFTAMFAEQTDLYQKSIGIYFTQDAVTPEPGTFYYNDYDSKWHFNADMELETSTYYLYGYIPKEAVESATISGNSSFSQGAVLTLNGLNTVTHNDISVVVGAKNGTDEDTDGGLTVGNFAVEAKAVGSGSNHIFLLFDHLYSAMRFSFKVDADYAKLRTIKLRKLELTAFNSNSSTKLKAKYNATITLQAGASPIQSVVFTQDETSADVAYEPLYSGDAVTLDPTTPTSFMGGFVPGRNTTFRLRSTYDVYDRQGNCVREGCEAVNNIDLRSIFNITALELQRGHIYTINMTVRPTYLYVLSEPDLDNPSLKIEV